MTGVLSFNSSQNFELPADSNSDNVYEVNVLVSDGLNADSQLVYVTINDTNEIPAGANDTVLAVEDIAYTFTIADFGFSDPDAGDSLGAVRIASCLLPELCD